MRVATMSTPPIVVDDVRLLERPEDELAVGPQPDVQEAAPTDTHASPDAAGGAELGAASPSSPYAGGITLQADGTQASGPQIAAETPVQQAPALDMAHGAPAGRPAVGPFGSSLVSLGPATPTGAQVESRLLPGSVLTTRTNTEGF
jgi:hypothetical protein